MKSKKDQFSKIFAFILLLLAFIASVFIGIKGAVIKVQAYIESKKPKPIILHQFYEDGKLWFYRPGTTEIQGTYQCNGKNIYCGYAYELIDDGSYAMQYYDSHQQVQYSTYLMGNYAFIIDAENQPDEGDRNYRNENVKLLNINTGSVEKEYGAIKSYGNTHGFDDSMFIARSTEGKWGIIQITATGAEEKVPFEYDFIGMFTFSIKSPPSITDQFVVKKGEKWSVINNTGTEIISNIPKPIHGYDGTTVVTLDGTNNYSIYNKDGVLLNTNMDYRSITFTGTGYILAKSNDIGYAIYDNTGKEVKSGQLFFKDEILPSTDGETTRFNVNGKEVYSGNNLSRNGKPITTQ